MLFDHLLAVGLSQWEEQLVAVAFLEQRDAIPGSFMPEPRRRMELAWRELCCLPERWAKELCFEVMLTARKNA